jgi:hypothetical protein
MECRKNERWFELCAQAAVEQDSKKLTALLNEISRLLEEREQGSGIKPPERL